MTAPGSHYFDEEPTAESAPREVTLWLPDASFVLMTDRGVFGYDRIDQGSKLLLLKAPPPAPTGHLLDLGCGNGPLALTMARRSPAATVWAVDVNERARNLCRANAERNGLPNVTVCAPDEVPGRHPLRHHLEQPGDPHRQGGPALDAAPLAGQARAARPATRMPARPSWWCTSISAATHCRTG